MSKDHGLAGLFGDDGAVRRKPEPEVTVETAATEDLPPVLDNADKSPLDLLSDKMELEKGPPDVATPLPQARERREEPVPPPVTEDRLGDETARVAGLSTTYDDPYADADEDGILCFLLDSDDDRARKRTLAALNVAAGNGSVSLRTLPSDPDLMDQTLEEALDQTECGLVAFLSAGTEPADDWAIECQRAFDGAPRTAAMTVRGANADPLSPWARVAFFMDEAERQKGIAVGFDTMVFRKAALREMGDKLGQAVRTGALVSAVQGRGHRIGKAPEARVSIATPSARPEVMARVKDNARLAARLRAKGKSAPRRFLAAVSVMLSYPFRIMAVRAAAKRSVGSIQFREVASKAAMAVFADRRVRAATLIKPGPEVR